jgi:RNA exonuclease 1
MTSLSNPRSLSSTTSLGRPLLFPYNYSQTNTLSSWSGITAEALTPVTTTHSTVQFHILSLLSEQPTPILLGHSLESDLKALRISHPCCIDTALMYHHPRGRPLKPGLAWLTKKWCGRVIQNRGEGGHDPEEDARACIELLKKKVENGQCATCLGPAWS